MFVFIFDSRRDQRYRCNLGSFLRNREITFTSVDTRNDKKVLNHAWMPIAPEYHIDIQDIIKLPGNGKRAGMGALAAAIIDPSYADMKKVFKPCRLRREGHDFWEFKPLLMLNLQYAAIDGYVSYELYRRIKVVNDAQRHLLPAPTQVICPRCKYDYDGEECSRANKRRKGPNGW